MVTMIGEHCIRCQTATQSAPALSSGEAEFLGNVKGASIGIGMQSTARDFGDERVVRIATDISASKGYCVKTQHPSSRRWSAVVTTSFATQSATASQHVWTRKSNRHRHQRPRGERHEANHEQTWFPRKDRKTSESTSYGRWSGLPWPGKEQENGEGLSQLTALD